MDSINFKFRWGFLRGIFRAERPPSREVTKCDNYVQLAYKVLSWDDPTLTLTAFLGLNFAFWIVTLLHLKLLGVIFITLLTALAADWLVEKKQLQFDHAYLDAVDELKTDLMDLILSLKALRKDSPSSFCFATSGFFLLLSIIARSISGYVLAYLALLSLFLVPLSIKLLPQEYVQKVKSVIRNVASEKGIIQENDLIPPQEEVRDAVLQSLMTEKTTDSIAGSLISGITSMPSHLDNDEGDSAMMKEDDLLPNDLSEKSSDSDSFQKNIRFDSGHFNGDSSSEDELNYQQSLTFDSVKTEIVAGTASHLLKLASDNMKRMLANSTTQPRQDSSSDSEFEIINPEEADNC